MLLLFDASPSGSNGVERVYADKNLAPSSQSLSRSQSRRFHHLPSESDFPFWRSSVIILRRRKPASNMESLEGMLAEEMYKLDHIEEKLRFVMDERERLEETLSAIVCDRMSLSNFDKEMSDTVMRREEFETHTTPPMRRVEDIQEEDLQALRQISALLHDTMTLRTLENSYKLDAAAEGRSSVFNKGARSEGFREDIENRLGETMYKRLSLEKELSVAVRKREESQKKLNDGVKRRERLERNLGAEMSRLVRLEKKLIAIREIEDTGGKSDME
ncbi:hypothetical protein AXG93_3083s1230 [Marchantia polymorpha subsp. ruderalis]|uniref:Uncharacterized protein n=1 Tax=Marchantia polymorpha subsp. ruderalis TaxID=1480154 RepID=A0A176VTX0_MARPO|nr:hypothetical protein AXG93_3083s1230 [Marchantia polymorpha subsp. ruderalis]